MPTSTLPIIHVYPKDGCLSQIGRQIAQKKNALAKQDAINALYTLKTLIAGHFMHRRSHFPKKGRMPQASPGKIGKHDLLYNSILGRPTDPLQKAASISLETETMEKPFHLQYLRYLWA